MSNGTPINYEPVITDEDGNTRLDTTFIKTIAEKIASEYFNTLTDEHINAINKAINEEIWEHLTVNDVKVFKKQVKKKGYYSSYEDTPLWAIVKEKYATKFSSIIDEKINDILNSEEVNKRLDEICHEIVDYAAEGYKNDMLKRLHERLVGNIIYGEPYYDNTSLRQIIHDEIKTYMS